MKKNKLIAIITALVAFLGAACATTQQALTPDAQKEALRLAYPKKWAGPWFDPVAGQGGQLAFRFALANNRLTGELVETSGSVLAPNLGALRHLVLKDGVGVAFTTPVGVNYDLSWQPDGCLAGTGIWQPFAAAARTINVRVCPAG